jgi:polyhydroxyalkanoate synthase
MRVDDRAVSLDDIHVPIFAVGTERDHVAPWRSVFKIARLADTDVTFLLASGGHNAGIVSEPGHPHRHFRMTTKKAVDPCVSAEEWLAECPSQEGSWWPAWSDWLASHSSPVKIAPPPTGSSENGYVAKEAAPGTYVHQR